VLNEDLLDPPGVRDVALEGLIGERIGDGKPQLESCPVRHSMPRLNSAVDAAGRILKSTLRTAGTQNASAKLASITELGAKVRTVTKHAVDEIVAAQWVRKHFYQALDEWAPTKDVMLGEKSAAVRRVVRGRCFQKLVYSSDLTSATDFAYQDAYKVVLREILTVWGFGPIACDSLVETLVGSHRLELDASMPGTEEFFRAGRSTPLQKRGVMMGMPMTWALLNLTNFFTFARAVHGKPITAADEERTSLLHKTGIDVLLDRAEAQASVCGDDLIAYTTRSVISRYEKRLGDIGYLANLTKSFISYHGGVFAEFSFRITRGPTQVNDPYPPLGTDVGDYGELPQQTVSRTEVKAVTALGDIPAKIFSSRAAPSQRAPFMDVGPPLTAALKEVPSLFRERVIQRMKRTTGVVCPGLVSRLQSGGIDTAAPRALGGAELPWCTKLLRISRKTASVLASPNLMSTVLTDDDGGILLAGNLGSAWTPEAHRAGAEYANELAVASIPISSCGFLEPYPGLQGAPVLVAHAGSYVDDVISAASDIVVTLVGEGIISPKVPKQEELTIPRVAKLLKRSRQRVLATYPAAAPSSHVELSILKYRAVVDALKVGPLHSTQLLFRHGTMASRRGKRAVVARPDLPWNRALLKEVIGVLVPGSEDILSRASVSERRGGALR